MSLPLYLLDDAPTITPSAALFPPERGKLHIVGTTFRTEDNALWQWRGYSWFLGFLRYCRGEDVTPDLRWLRAMGFNIVRVFGPLPWKETPDYRVEHFRFDMLDGFFDLLAAHGLRCNWSLGHYDDPWLHAHVQQWYEIASQHWNVVAEGVNEPAVGQKPDPEDLLAGVARRGILTSYGKYAGYYDKQPGLDRVLDFGTIHIARDAAWHRKARHAQEIQHETGKPWISDEPAKITEPGFDYPGGKNDVLLTPAHMTWHAAICCLWTPGFTFHCEEGKWGRVPQPGMLQHTVAEAVRDHVFLKIDASWQEGAYAGAHMSKSPVDGKGLRINGSDIWTYSSLQTHRALSVRCALSAPQARAGWIEKTRWGPGGSLVELAR